MKKLLIIVAVTLTIQVVLNAQPCLPEGIIFTTQEEIDNFEINYPNCTEIGGNVTISGSDITNLNGLNIITKIEGSLNIHYNHQLIVLTGFESLIEIGQTLSVYKNNLLKEINGFNNLNVIGKDLKINDNDSLLSFSGFENLSIISEDILIDNNKSLISLSGFNGLNKILGDFELFSNESLNSLSGLDNLDTIMRYMEIDGNSALINLQGLNNLKYVKYIAIGRNDSLINLEGLDNLTYVKNGFDIWDNDYLINLMGLNNLKSTDGSISIWENSIMQSLSGLDSLENIDGDLLIYFNDSLQDLTALSSLVSIGGELEIEQNDNLASLNGLQNIQSSSISDLTILGNHSLTNCEIQSICEYLSDPNGKVTIYGNAPGCSNPPEIAESCGYTMPCLPFGDYILITQNEIDNFETDYPDCVDLNGRLLLRGNDITNLLGLSAVHSISGGLNIEHTMLIDLTGLNEIELISKVIYIYNNDSLENLNGLESLKYLGGSLEVNSNDALINLSGLDNLDSIDGGITLLFNDKLTDLTSLYGVKKMGYYYLEIMHNDLLENLYGLDSIDAGSIYRFICHDNINLSTCDVQSICNFLFDSDSEAFIYDNASGCNSEEEIEEACTVSIPETSCGENVSVYPNPFTTSTTIEYELSQPSEVIISIYNHFGELVKVMRQEQSAGRQQVVWNAEGLPAGVYYFRLSTGQQSSSGKLVLVR